MNNILINNTSIRSLGWYVKTKTISKPEIRTNYVEIPGRNGSLDLTELFGSIPYGDRQVDIELICIDYASAQDLLLTLAAYVHGKSITLTETEENTNTFNAQTSYTARLSITDHGYDGKAYTAKLSGIASPQANYYRNVMQDREINLSEIDVPFNLAWTTGVNMVCSVDEELEDGQTINMKINDNYISVQNGVPVSLSNNEEVGSSLVVGTNTISYIGLNQGAPPYEVNVTIGEGVSTYN